jgi:hypothetical protein
VIFTKNYKLPKKSIYRSLTVLACLFILIGNAIVGGYNLSISKTFAQQYYSSDPIGIPGTISATIDSPINSGLNIAHHTINGSNNFGLCNPINNNSSNLPTITSAETLTHTGKVTVGPQTLSDTIHAGSDNFKFIYSYWSKDSTEQGLGITPPSTSTPIETDVNGGPNLLAVVLHYEGAIDLTGISAALKLPSGFKSNLPLTHNTNRYDIAFSSWQGKISPGTTIVLNFPITILGNAEIQKPYVGLLALHFLKAHEKTLKFGLDASDEDKFVNALTIASKIPSPPASPGSLSTKMCNNDNTFTKQVTETDTLMKLFDFVHQINAITFKVTGEENLNVNVAVEKETDDKSKGNIPSVSTVEPTDLHIFINNTGDAPVYDLKARFTAPTTEPTVVQTKIDTTSQRDALTAAALLASRNGVNSNTSNNLDTILASQILNSNMQAPTSTSNTPDSPSPGGSKGDSPTPPPAVIIGPSLFSIGILPAQSYTKITLKVLGNSIVDGTINNFKVNLGYTDVTGVKQLNQDLPMGVFMSAENKSAVKQFNTLALVDRSLINH